MTCGGRSARVVLTVTHLKTWLNDDIYELLHVEIAEQCRNEATSLLRLSLFIVNAFRFQMAIKNRHELERCRASQAASRGALYAPRAALYGRKGVIVRVIRGAWSRPLLWRGVTPEAHAVSPVHKSSASLLGCQLAAVLGDVKVSQPWCVPTLFTPLTIAKSAVMASPSRKKAFLPFHH